MKGCKLLDLDSCHRPRCTPLTILPMFLDASSTVFSPPHVALLPITNLALLPRVGRQLQLGHLWDALLESLGTSVIGCSPGPVRRSWTIRSRLKSSPSPGLFHDHIRRCQKFAILKLNAIAPRGQRGPRIWTHDSAPRSFPPPSCIPLVPRFPFDKNLSVEWQQIWYRIPHLLQLPT